MASNENELNWLEKIIEEFFKILSILAEPFLAFGLMASGIDYGMHGQFLGSNAALMSAWTITQGIALEGSGGVALAMSFKAANEGDKVKAWCQRILAIALLLVGGIMFFVEISNGALGHNESAMPDWYVYLMSALRALVSLGYVAVCRTKRYRFSGTAPEVVQMQSMQEAVQSAVQGMQSRVQDAVMGAVHDALLTRLTAAVQSQIADLQTVVLEKVHAAVETEGGALHATLYEELQQLTDACFGDTLINDVRRICNELMQDVHITEVQSAPPALNAPRRPALPASEPHTDALQPLKSSAVATPESAVENAENDAPGGYKDKIFAYVQLQCAQGNEPTAQEIMAAVQCGQRTAFKYRKAALENALMPVPSAK